MSSAEIIALLCVLCLAPLWAAGSIIVFALGGVRCGRLMDPYFDGGGGGKRDRCPMNRMGPSTTTAPEDRKVRDRRATKLTGGLGSNESWGGMWKSKESCPSGHGASSTEPG